MRIVKTFPVYKIQERAILSVRQIVDMTFRPLDNRCTNMVLRLDCLLCVCVCVFVLVRVN